MDIALAALVFAPALALGSFLNVVVARLPESRSLVRPRSSCRACGYELAWHDNIPLLSYLALRGCCRRCREPIGARYPAVELATAVLVVACFSLFGVTPRALVAAFFAGVLVVLSAIDLERRILPNRIVLPAALLVLAAELALDPRQGAESIVAALAASLVLLLPSLASPGAIGMGDVKLGLLLGAALGWNVVAALVLGFVLVFPVALWLVVRRGAAVRGAVIPLGPFLAGGGILALFLG